MLDSVRVRCVTTDTEDVNYSTILASPKDNVHSSIDKLSHHQHSTSFASSITVGLLADFELKFTT